MSRHEGEKLTYLDEINPFTNTDTMSTHIHRTNDTNNTTYNNTTNINDTSHNKTSTDITTELKTIINLIQKDSNISKDRQSAIPSELLPNEPSQRINIDLNSTKMVDNINQNLINSIAIDTTPILVSTNSLPTRCVPVYNPEKGDCHRNKTDSSMRYMIQNANGLQPHTQVKWEGYLDRLDHLNVNIVGIVETCTNWGH
jgi:hypothetical protein